MSAENVFEQYMKAKEAYDTIPKAFFKREYVDGVTRYSCSSCGVIYAEIPSYVFQVSFDQPIFCCGKLLR